MLQETPADKDNSS
jgi:superfamily II DNA/RNA helicase